jgi:DNA-binding transcriptional LysR family regulator
MPTKELLSLFPVFDAIYSEENLSRAAEKLGVSQSAVSQSLARLRQLTSDELFLSTGRGMRPTPRAILMITHVRAALAEAQAVARPKELDLATLSRTFNIDVGAGYDCIMVPLIFREIEREAPHVRLNISSIRAVDPSNALRTGDIDVAFDFMPPTAQEIRCQSLAPSPAVVIARTEHPALVGGLDEKTYFAARHAQLNWSRPEATSGLALELRRIGRNVNVVVTLPTLSGLGATVAVSDLLATISEGAARYLVDRHPLAVHPLPLKLANAQFFQCWHERFDNDPGHVWLRELIARVCATARTYP